jgi:hypothetical protein
MADKLSQRARLLVLGAYVVLLFAASKIALASWLPPTSEKGIWFYSGLAAILLGNLLVTPFFTKPADAISYAVAALVALLATSIWSSAQYTGFDMAVWLVAVVYVAAVLAAGMISIATRNSSRHFWAASSKSLYLFSDVAGNPRAIFSVVFFFALITFHRSSPHELLTIGLVWAIAVGLRPLEAILDLGTRLWRVWKSGKGTEYLGEIVGHETPGVVLIRHDKNSCVPMGDLLIARGDDGHPGLALALDYIGLADGLWLRAIHIIMTPELRRILDSLLSGHHYPDEAVLRVDQEAAKALAACDETLARRPNLVGLVASNTDIGRLRFEVTRTDTDLEEGRLVEVHIAGRPVLYQVVNGLTKEEILQQKNSRGFVQAEAKKIGTWNTNLRRFEAVRWIPQPNAPVFLASGRRPSPDREVIGFFPGTDYPVTVDLPALVTHNTAILGILGVGKTFLALELIERMIHAGIKVLCLDLTGQYAKELSAHYDERRHTRRIWAMQKEGRKGLANVQRNVEEGGSIRHFQDMVRRVLRKFLKPTMTCRLAVFNPNEFEVWRQDSKPFQDKASMASMTPTEVARVFAEAALDVLQSQGLTDKARCCIVLEEAHSIVPEWNSIAAEGDRMATNGTAKAVLQGRKYGLGCLLITQRTANVTKSILNQCNTVFAMRLFDATGMDFLKNYVGEDYAGVLSTLEDRHAVVFGRASSCRNPVLIRLNDREDFLRIFRAPEGGPKEATK